MVSYLFSILISSFLLFQIQPLIAKYFLPWFGGTSGVWSASLLFFQVLLTAGYGYSFWLTSKFSKIRQTQIHLGLLVLSLGVILANAFRWISPILPVRPMQTLNFNQPLIAIIGFLFSAVGMPYFLLSTNSTLMQVWFTYEKENRSPFPLYAVSNAGSLIGLLSYPFLFEPSLTLISHSYIWVAAYILFVILVGSRAWSIQHKNYPGTYDLHEYIPKEGRDSSFKRRISWIFFSALASMLLLATTNHITQEVASIPFLWVLPFSVYLLSFILVFSSPRFYNRFFFVGLLFVATIIYIWFVDSAHSNIVTQIILHTSLLFICSMICHGELYAIRPGRTSLTSFYLMMSIGGAIGGLLVNILFPNIFSGFWEYQLGIGLVWISLIVVCNNRAITNRYYLDRVLRILVGLSTIVVFASLYLRIGEYVNESIISKRNFYGLIRVKELSENDPENHRYVLTHGITTHGFQFTSPGKQKLPTSYYSEKSGIGIGINQHPIRPEPMRAGFVGLGAGVLASYGQDGDQFYFYEINPEVVAIAQSKYFTFLTNSNAEIKILLGDGRLLLEQELSINGSQKFDLLVLDAFNSDSIPTHLITFEAVKLYLEHLNPDGLLAFHISNRFLDLEPVIDQIAEKLGMDGITFYDKSKDERISPSSWIILTNNQKFLTNPDVLKQGSLEHADYDSLSLWTDDYSNMISVLK